MVGKLASVRRPVSGAAGAFCFSGEPAEPASQMLPTATAFNAANRILVDDMVLYSSLVDHRRGMWPGPIILSDSRYLAYPPPVPCQGNRKECHAARTKAGFRPQTGAVC